MTDQLISLETAKLAEKKGFLPKPGQKTQAYICRYAEHQLDSYKGKLTKDPLTCDIWAPTQTSLHKWLRENYKLHIVVRQMNLVPHEYQSAFFYKNKNHSTSNLPTYEEALEVALVKALNLIK